jgi:hypothetical protein
VIKDLVNEEAIARAGLQSQREIIIIILIMMMIIITLRVRR